ncbi:MAG: hypothetical protein UT30_C0026G0004 [Candidatus Uhrbacteria bacterium GW2011_GWF2_39_13]|uniref:HTH gntR-type domain-containing protein n=1 Tax=Candidatus Uhrbacteria bacterium GW2011_GWF2_39_13 TaxID=1618995 RepID=A0A0G0MHK9_9BACT|nr:MAG: hypothetical protein UT30_C0026G0004 [Candidatus Uhrbacteria bacterium GW2011_GWF2_39_13]
MNKFICMEEIRESILPKYYQIYIQLKKEIFFNGYKSGERFFCLRKLQDEYKVNMQTVREAVKLLVGDNFLKIQPSSGLYIGNFKRDKLKVSMGNLWFCQFGKEYNHPYYNSLIAGLQDEAKSYRLNCIVNENSDKAEFLRWFRPETGDGLAVTGELDEELIELLRALPYLRYVIIGNYILPEGTPNIRHNIVNGVQRAIMTASSLGRKKLTLIAGTERKETTQDILKGISLVQDVQYVHGIFSEEEDGYSAMLSLDKRKSSDSILVTEPAFYGLCRYVFENRIKCPDELFVIRFGKNEERNSYDDIAAVNISADKKNLCRHTVEMLFRSQETFLEIPEEVTLSDSLKKVREPEYENIN